MAPEALRAPKVKPWHKDMRSRDRLIVPVQIRRTCRASFSDLDNVRQEKLAPSPTPLTYPPLIPLVNILRRYERYVEL